MAKIWHNVLDDIQKQVLFNPSYVQSFPSELQRPSKRPVLTKYQLQCLQRYYFIPNDTCRPYRFMFMGLISQSTGRDLNCTYLRCLVQPESEANENPESSFRNILETAIINSENLDYDETGTRADALIEQIFTSNQRYLRFQFAFENYAKPTKELIQLYAKYEGQPIEKDQIKSSKMEQTLVEFSVTYDNELITIQETGFS